MDVKEKLYQKNLSMAKKGLLWGLMGGLLYGISPMFQTLGMGTEPLSSGAVLGLCAIPMIVGCLQDFSSGIWVLIPNLKNGKRVHPVRKNQTGTFYSAGVFFRRSDRNGWFYAWCLLCRTSISCGYQRHISSHRSSVIPDIFKGKNFGPRLVRYSAVCGWSHYGQLGAAIWGYLPELLSGNRLRSVSLCRMVAGGHYLLCGNGFC